MQIVLRYVFIALYSFLHVYLIWQRPVKLRDDITMYRSSRSVSLADSSPPKAQNVHSRGEHKSSVQLTMEKMIVMGG